MGRRKSKSVPSWQHDPSNGNGHFIQLYASMLEHPAWISLTPRAQATYLYCVRNSYGQATKDDAERTGGRRHNELFYLSQGDAVRFGLCAENDRRALPRAMAELVEHGFVDQMWSGQKTRSRNVYRLSNRWHKWGTQEFSMPENYMTTSMKNIGGERVARDQTVTDTRLGPITWYVTSKGVCMVVDVDGRKRRAKRVEIDAISEIVEDFAA